MKELRGEVGNLKKWKESAIMETVDKNRWVRKQSRIQHWLGANLAPRRQFFRWRENPFKKLPSGALWLFSVHLDSEFGGARLQRGRAGHPSPSAGINTINLTSACSIFGTFNKFLLHCKYWEVYWLMQIQSSSIHRLSIVLEPKKIFCLVELTAHLDPEWSINCD
jgi:hypothetical protein